MTQDDEALVQKLIDLNRRLTQIASNKTAGNVDDVETKPIPFVTNKRELNTRITSLEDYLDTIGSQLEKEEDENKRLANILRTKMKLSNVNMNDARLRDLTKELQVLRNNLNQTQQQLVEERQQHKATIEQTKNKLRILKTEHNAYQKINHISVEKELNTKQKINDISTENERFKLEIDRLKKKITDCNAIITENDESNKQLLNSLKNEKYIFYNKLHENEKQVNQLKTEMNKLTKENHKLEMALKDRDNLHDKLIKNKKVYENALGELLNAKKAQTELEKELKQKMFALNRLDQTIKKEQKEKNQLSHSLSHLQQTYQTDMKQIKFKNEDEIKKLKNAVRYQQIKYEEMKSKHEALGQSLLSKANICCDLKD
eukprot:662445_1